MPPAPPPKHIALLLGLLFALSWLPGPGLVSSNDGSHLALSRALALRHETTIDPDRDLCLRVDVARRGRHTYSDRPPGTAFIAAPAAWLGAQLDPTVEQWSRAAQRVLVPPARRNFAVTYAARHRDGPPLIALQGTALVIGAHVRLMGLLGLALLFAVLAELGVCARRRGGIVVAFAVASLWGPYSTMLFSHVTAATALLALWWALLRDAAVGAGGEAAAPGQRRWLWPLLGGAAGALAIASDYLLLLAVVPMVALHAPPRRWPVWLAGALPVASLVALYHQAAFGSPLAVGYDFQQNFAFARDRRSTFDGSLLNGLGVLWGTARGAGLLAQSPIWLLGLLGLGHRSTRRAALALLPWVVALALHHTPWGGGTEDHRYILPVLPFLAVGLAVAWQRLAVRSPRRERLVVAAGLALAAWSSWRVWGHFLAWRG